MISALAVEKPDGELVPFAYEPGRLKEGEVEIDVAYCGICYSDLSMIRNEWGMTQYPLIPGHEVVGTVSATGPGVDSLNVGDRVGLGWHCGYCNQCASCKSGDHNLCDSPSGTIVQHHGGFATKVRADANSVVLLPPELLMETAGPLMCAGITVFNPLVQFKIKPGDQVGVIGIGGLGHLATQFLRLWGCEVTAFTSRMEKHEELLSMGAHHVVDSRDVHALRGYKQRFDFHLCTANANLDWNLYLSTLKARGRFHFVGATMAPLNLSVFSLIGKQRSVSGSTVGSPDVIRQMLAFAVQHNIKPIAEIFPMSQANRAFQHLNSGKARYRIVLEQDLS